MAYTSPPTFLTGAVLTAAQLNILSDDIEYLYGKVQSVNTPFTSLVSTGNLTSSNNLWYIRHLHRYLHYHCYLANDTADRLQIFYNGTEIFDDASNYSAPKTYQSYIDLNPYGFTVGTFYPLYIAAAMGGTFSVYYLLESDSTSL